MGGRLSVGDRIQPRRLCTVHGSEVTLPDARRVTHLQFRRFAGCPVCNLHLQSFRRRKPELERAGVHEVVFFHSTAADLRAYGADATLDIVADPQKAIYRAFGVESGVRAVLDPRAWAKIFAAVASSLRDIVLHGARVPPLDPGGGRYGLPADFLIDRSGVITAAHYGAHVDDQWSVDQVLQLAAGGGDPA